MLVCASKAKYICTSQVLNTVFWLGKAASGCASFSGPTLNLKEFEGLLAQMKLVSEQREEEEEGDGQKVALSRCWGRICWVSCLCWGARETHDTENRLLFLLHHSFSYFRERLWGGIQYGIKKKLGLTCFFHYLDQYGSICRGSFTTYVEVLFMFLFLLPFCIFTPHFWPQKYFLCIFRTWDSCLHCLKCFKLHHFPAW